MSSLRFKNNIFFGINGLVFGYLARKKRWLEKSGDHHCFQVFKSRLVFARDNEDMDQPQRSYPPEYDPFLLPSDAIPSAPTQQPHLRSNRPSQRSNEPLPRHSRHDNQSYPPNDPMQNQSCWPSWSNETHPNPQISQPSQSSGPSRSSCAPNDQSGPDANDMWTRYRSPQPHNPTTSRAEQTNNPSCSRNDIPDDPFADILMNRQMKRRVDSAWDACRSSAQPDSFPTTTDLNKDLSGTHLNDRLSQSEADEVEIGVWCPGGAQSEQKSDEEILNEYFKNNEFFNPSWDGLSPRANAYRTLLFISPVRSSRFVNEQDYDRLNKMYKNLYLYYGDPQLVYRSTDAPSEETFQNVRGLLKCENNLIKPATTGRQPYRYSPYIYPDNLSEEEKMRVRQQEDEKCCDTRNKNEAAFRRFFKRYIPETSDCKNSSHSYEVYFCPSDLITYFFMRVHQFPPTAYKRFQLHPGSITHFEIHSKSGKVTTACVGQKAHLISKY